MQYFRNMKKIGWLVAGRGGSIVGNERWLAIKILNTTQKLLPITKEGNTRFLSFFQMVK